MDAKEVGRTLRERREALGLTLADVQAALKIRRRYLEAIEAGEPEALPGAVYGRGFVRAYASYLGLDGFALAEAWRSATEGQGPPSEPAESAPPPQPRVPRPRGASTRRARRRTARLWLAAVGLVAAAVLAGLWWLGGRAPQAPEAAAPPPAPSATPSGAAAPVGDEADPEGAPSEAAPPAPAPQPTEPAPQVTIERGEGRVTYRVSGAPLVVDFALTGRCWLRVHADGRLVFEGTLAAGAQRTFRAERQLVVRAGNPGALQVTVAGRALGAPGPRDPVTLHFLWVEP